MSQDPKFTKDIESMIQDIAKAPVKKPGLIKLYHFTAKHLLNGIMDHGIRFGKVPSFGKTGSAGKFEFLGFIKGYQWLTTNSDFDQSWAKQTHLKYTRTDYRLQILIKQREKNKLIKWTYFAKKNAHRLAGATHELLNLPEGSDPENWYLFKGVIRPECIIEIKARVIEEGAQAEAIA